MVHQPRLRPSNHAVRRLKRVGVSRYICPGCDYVYDETTGNEHEGFPPGMSWNAVPGDWFCPDCGVRDKRDFALAT